jgi:hypothetical protein
MRRQHSLLRNSMHARRKHVLYTILSRAFPIESCSMTG